MKPRTLILRTAGTNCDRETAHAFELAGSTSAILHLNRLIESPQSLREYQLLAIPGGFSYGDDISAGRIFAKQLSHHLGEVLGEFISQGKPVIGICNGFQVLVKLGLLPGPLDGRTGQLCTLSNNDRMRFEDRWVHLASCSDKCIWTKGLSRIELPIAHGEGKFVPADDAVRRALWQQDQVALVYTRPDGDPARGEFPHNPNGSADDIAGICDHTGLILGLMPHPERHVDPIQHPGWTKRPSSSDGLEIFARGVRWVSNPECIVGAV